MSRSFRPSIAAETGVVAWGSWDNLGAILGNNPCEQQSFFDDKHALVECLVPRSVPLQQGVSVLAPSLLSRRRRLRIALIMHLTRDCNSSCATDNSLCIEKGQPFCHYGLKTMGKTRTKLPAASQQRLCSTETTSSVDVDAASQMVVVGDPAAHAARKATAVAGTSTVEMSSLWSPVKRCRLSASPATGLVGLEESGLLDDFFGCFGTLNFANESTVRRGIVDILIRATAPPRQLDVEPQDLGNDGFSSVEQAEEAQARFTELEEHSSGRASVCLDSAGDPAKCVMWCAIALGALMRGSPVENVTNFIRLARESLSQCFDTTSVGNVRAFLMISFLYKVLHDEEKSDKYLSFAMRIMEDLGPDAVPEEVKTMSLTIEKMGVLRFAGRRMKQADVRAYCDETLDLPPVRGVMDPKDVSRIVLVADRRLNQAFMRDSFPQEPFGYADKPEGNEEEGEAIRETFLTQSGGIAGAGNQDGKACVKDSQLPAGKPSKLVRPSGNDQEISRVGNAKKDFVQEVLPELLQLSRMLEGSGACSDARSLVLHGDMAYMRFIHGDVMNFVASFEACVDVIKRYPGIARFRPHLMHGILGSSHFTKQRDMYDAVREVYNSVLPLPGSRPAPPYEEFMGLHHICDKMICSSAQAGFDNCGSNQVVEPTAGAPSRQATRLLPQKSSSFDVGSTLTREGTQTSGLPSSDTGLALEPLAGIPPAVSLISSPAESTPELPVSPRVHPGVGDGIARRGFDPPHFKDANALTPEWMIPAPSVQNADVCAEVSGKQKLCPAIPAGDFAFDSYLEGELEPDHGEPFTDADLSYLASLIES